MIALAYVGPVAVLVLFAELVKRAARRSELGEDEVSPDPDTKGTT